MRFIFFIIVCFFSLSLSAQDVSEKEQFILTEKAWEEASGNLDYSKDVEKKQDKEPKEVVKNEEGNDISLPNFDFTGLGTFIQLIVICMGAFLIGWALYYFIKQPSNKRIDKQGVVTIENLEEHLDESDLDRFLRQALEQGRYGDAVRIHFLEIIKSLNEKGHIKWSKDKTNRDYLHELNQSTFLKAMRKQTRIYEKVWYGNMEVDNGLYSALAPAFKALKDRIQT